MKGTAWENTEFYNLSETLLEAERDGKNYKVVVETCGEKEGYPRLTRKVYIDNEAYEIQHNPVIETKDGFIISFAEPSTAIRNPYPSFPNVDGKRIGGIKLSKEEAEEIKKQNNNISTRYQIIKEKIQEESKKLFEITEEEKEELYKSIDDDFFKNWQE